MQKTTGDDRRRLFGPLFCVRDHQIFLAFSHPDKKIHVINNGLNSMSSTMDWAGVNNKCDSLSLTVWQSESDSVTVWVWQCDSLSLTVWQSESDSLTVWQSESDSQSDSQSLTVSLTVKHCLYYVVFATERREGVQIAKIFSSDKKLKFASGKFEFFVRRKYFLYKSRPVGSR